MGYYAGIDCKCNASVERECCCSNVDWTPTEVYRLRAQLVKAQKQLASANSEITELSVATLNAVQSMSGGKAKADLRDAYDKASNFIEKLEGEVNEKIIY